MTALSFPLLLIGFALCLAHEFDLDKEIDRVTAEYQKKDYEDALNTVQQAIARHPGSAAVHFWKGRLLEKSHQFDEAAREYEKACANSPMNLNFVNFRAKAYSKAGRFADAISDYNRLLSNQYYHTSYNYANRGYAELMKQQYEDALRDFDQAIRLEPLKRDYYGSRAYAYAGLKEYDQAISEWNNLIEKNPKDAMAYAERGQIKLRQKHLEAAEADIAASIAIKPTALAYFWRGLIKRDQKHLQSAITDYEQALELDHNNVNVLKESALAYIELNKPEQALGRLAKLDKIGQSAMIPNFLELKAKAELDLGHFAAAAADLQKLIAKKPGDQFARINHALCAEKMHDFGRAYEDYTALLEQEPGNATLLVQRGRISILEKKYDMGENDLDRALKLDDRNTQAYLWRGIASGERGVYGQALVDLSHALKLQPGNTQAKQIYEKYSRLKTAHELAAPAPGRVALSGNTEKDAFKLIESGNVSAGIKRLAAVVEQHPSDPAARRYLAYALLQTGQFSDAADQFKALATLSKLAPQDDSKYIEALIAAKREAEAAALLQSKLDRDAYDVDTRLRLARLYSNLGWRDKARATCRSGMADYRSINDFKKLKSTLENLEAGWRDPKGGGEQPNIGG